MKNKFVLITVFLWANALAVLAQTNIDTAAVKKDTVRVTSTIPTIQNTPAVITPAPIVNKPTPVVVTKDTVRVATTTPTSPNTPAVITPAPIVNTPTPVVITKDTLAHANTPDTTNNKSSVPIVPAVSKKAPIIKTAKSKKTSKKNKSNEITPEDMPPFFAAVPDSAKVPKRSAHISLENARPIPLPEPSITNVKFYHRYWRDIDLSDKRNKALASYHAVLINSLLKAIKNGKLTAYNPEGGIPSNPSGDWFTRPITYTKLMSGLTDTAYVDKFDKDGNKIGSVPTVNAFTPDKITGYRIKEDVYYDKALAKTVTRIVGVAPLLKLTLSSGEVVSIQPLCWFRFKDMRNVLVTIEASDPNQRVVDSMDDVFLQRRFTSTIIQESNLQGLRIKDYKTDPADQQNEAKRMEGKIASFKASPWAYTLSAEDVAQPIATTRIIKKPKSIKPIVTAQQH